MFRQIARFVVFGMITVSCWENVAVAMQRMQQPVVATRSTTRRMVATRRNVRGRAGINPNSITANPNKTLKSSNTFQIKLFVDDSAASKYANLRSYMNLSGNKGYILLLKNGQSLPDLSGLVTNATTSGVKIGGVLIKNTSTVVYDQDGNPKSPLPNINSGTELMLASVKENGGGSAGGNANANIQLDDCPNITDSDYTGYDTKAGDIQIRKATMSNLSTMTLKDCAVIVRDTVGLCYALTAAEAGTWIKGNRVIVPCDEYKFNNGVYQTCNGSYSANGPCDGYNIVNNNYLGYANHAVITVRADATGGGMLEFNSSDAAWGGLNIMMPDNMADYLPAGLHSVVLPDLSKLISAVHHSGGKVLRGINGQSDGSGTWFYDATGKPNSWVINRNDIPSTDPTILDTGGRPYLMFMIWEDSTPTQPTQYFVRYECNGSQNEFPETQHVNIGDSVTLHQGSVCATPSDSHFDGWWCHKNASTNYNVPEYKSLYAGGEELTPVVNTVCFAKWVQNNCPENSVYAGNGVVGQDNYVTKTCKCNTGYELINGECAIPKYSINYVCNTPNVVNEILWSNIPASEDTDLSDGALCGTYPAHEITGWNCGGTPYALGAKYTGRTDITCNAVWESTCPEHSMYKGNHGVVGQNGFVTEYCECDNGYEFFNGICKDPNEDVIVSFDCTEGEGSPEPLTPDADGVIALPGWQSCVRQYCGHYWMCDGVQYDQGKTFKPTHSTTCTAKWSCPEPVTEFVCHGSDNTSVQCTNRGGALPYPIRVYSECTHYGNKPCGWSKKSKATCSDPDIISPDAIPICSEKYYAIWE